MTIIKGLGGLKGFDKWYDYAYKYTHMITKTANKRLKIIRFWRKHGLEAATEAFGVKRSTIFGWWKIYIDSGRKEESLNPGNQAPKKRRERIVNPLILNEIKRLRLEECPNMGKEKIRKNLDPFCVKHKIDNISESTIGRIIKDKRIYHHRQKMYHNGRIKIVKRTKKKRKPKDLAINEPGSLIEVDTIVKFIHGMKRYIITAVDVYSRNSFAYAYKRHDSASTKDFLKKLEKALPYEIKAIQTDNGSEFHRYFKEYLEERDIVHYWNYPGKPYKNGHVEKYNRTIQDEFVDDNEILLENPEEFNEKLMDWLLWYNTKRFHFGIKLMTPVDYLIKNNWIVQYVVN